MIQSIWHLDNLESEIRDEELTTNQLLYRVNALYSMISTGTEKLVSKGLLDKEFEERMSVPYMEGSFEFPIKYGYSLVGKVESKDYLNNTLVHLLHPHQSVCFVQKEDLFIIPEEIPPIRATLISNMETVLNAIWDAELEENDTILILGMGSVGALLAITLKEYFQLNVAVFDTNEQRLELFENLGFSTQINGSYSLIFNATSNINSLDFCLEKLKKEGRVVDLNFYGNQKISLALGKYFHFNRLKIISSQVSTISPNQPEINFLKRKRIAVEILKNPIFDVLFSKSLSIKEAIGFFNHLREDKPLSKIIYTIKY